MKFLDLLITNEGRSLMMSGVNSAKVVFTEVRISAEYIGGKTDDEIRAMSLEYFLKAPEVHAIPSSVVEQQDANGNTFLSISALISPSPTTTVRAYAQILVGKLKYDDGRPDGPLTLIGVAKPDGSASFITASTNGALKIRTTLNISMSFFAGSSIVYSYDSGYVSKQEFAAHIDTYHNRYYSEKPIYKDLAEASRYVRDGWPFSVRDGILYRSVAVSASDPSGAAAVKIHHIGTYFKNGRSTSVFGSKRGKQEPGQPTAGGLAIIENWDSRDVFRPDGWYLWRDVVTAITNAAINYSADEGAKCTGISIVGCVENFCTKHHECDVCLVVMATVQLTDASTDVYCGAVDVYTSGNLALLFVKRVTGDHLYDVGEGEYWTAPKFDDPTQYSSTRFGVLMSGSNGQLNLITGANEKSFVIGASFARPDIMAVEGFTHVGTTLVCGKYAVVLKINPQYSDEDSGHMYVIVTNDVVTSVTVEEFASVDSAVQSHTTAVNLDNVCGIFGVPSGSEQVSVQSGVLSVKFTTNSGIIKTCVSLVRPNDVVAIDPNTPYADVDFGNGDLLVTPYGLICGTLELSPYKPNAIIYHTTNQRLLYGYDTVNVGRDQAICVSLPNITKYIKKGICIMPHLG